MILEMPFHICKTAVKIGKSFLHCFFGGIEITIKLEEILSPLNHHQFHSNSEVWPNFKLILFKFGILLLPPTTFSLEKVIDLN